MNIPNILTLIRLLLIPAFIYAFTFENNVATSIVILAVSGITDVLDGYIARRFNQITKWGIVFDPLADKLTQITVALCIALKGHIVMWFVLGFLVIKELMMLLGGITLYKKGDVVVKANWYGKAATLFFYILFFVLIIFGENMPYNAEIAMVCFAISVSIFALIRYIIVFLKMRKNLL